jgi:hypothetical protein
LYGAGNERTLKVTPNTDAWQSTRAAARHFNLAPKTLRRWGRRGAPYLQAGRVFRWNISEVTRWLEAEANRRGVTRLID